MFQNKDRKILYTAIVFFRGQMEKRPHKYRNVTTTNFIKYANTLGAHYVNFYKADKSYSHREYCQPLNAIKPGHG